MMYLLYGNYNISLKIVLKTEILCVLHAAGISC